MHRFHTHLSAFRARLYENNMTPKFDSIAAQIRSFVVQNYLFGQPDSCLADRDSFLENGIIDSTGVLELVAFLETTYSIKITDDELVPGNLDSIDNITRYLTCTGVLDAVQEATGR